MRTQRSARPHGGLLVAVVLTVGVAAGGPAWATGVDPLGDVTETVDQITGPVDDVVDQVTGPVEEAVDEVTEPVKEAVDQVTGAVDDTTGAAAGTPGGRGAEEGSGGSKEREGRERAGSSHGGVKRNAGTVEASSPASGREGWYQGMPDAGASQVRAAPGPCPNGIDAGCLLDALYGAGTGAAEVLGTLVRRLAATGLGLLALAMIALLAAGSGGAMLTWSGRRERRRAV